MRAKSDLIALLRRRPHDPSLRLACGQVRDDLLTTQLKGHVSNVSHALDSQKYTSNDGRSVRFKSAELRTRSVMLLCQDAGRLPKLRFGAGQFGADTGAPIHKIGVGRQFESPAAQRRPASPAPGCDPGPDQGDLRPVRAQLSY